MKKSLKISTMILASSMLISVGGAFLANSFNSQQNTSLLNYQYDAQTNNVQRADSLSNIKYSVSKSSSNSFAIIESADGDKLYGWGENNWGQLGTGDKNGKSSPTLIEIPGLPVNTKISAIACGLEFTLLLINNEIYVAGYNNWGQLGLGSAVRELNVFTKNNHTNFSGTITSISAGMYDATAIIDNKLYFWGNNEYGQGALETSTLRVWEPTQITSPDWTSGIFRDNKNGGSQCSVLYNNSLYIWGSNKLGAIGNGKIGGNVTTPYKVNLSGNIEQFDLYYDALLVLVDGKLYGWGNGNYGKFGNGSISNILEPTPLEVPSGVLKSINVGINFIMLQIDDKLYGSGLNSSGQLGVGDIVSENDFRLIDDFLIQEDAFVSCGFKSASVYMNGLMYGWGSSAYFGDGTSGNPTKPVLIQLFGVTSQTLTAKDPENNKEISAAHARNAFNPTGASINRIEIAKYVDGIDSFPNNAIFTVKSGTNVVVDKTNGTIALTITADRFFNEDGVNINTPIDFTLEMSGFLTITDSAIINRTIPPKYNSNNIQSLLKGDGKIANNEVLNDLMDISFFPDNTTFKVSQDKIDFANKSYVGVFIVDKYFKDGNLIPIGTVFPFNFTGLRIFSDSSVTEKTLTGDKYYVHNIAELLGTENVNIENLKEVVNLIDFPDDATYKIKNPTVNNDTYTSDLIPSAYYLGASLITNTNGIKAFPIRVTGLKKAAIADSAIIAKSVISDKYNLNNLDYFLSGDTLEATLHDVADVISFPAGTVFTRMSADGPDFDKGTYEFIIKASKYYLDGTLVNAENTSFTITLSGLSGEIIPDSSVKQKTLTGNKYNLNNITDLLGTTNVNMDNLLEVVDLISFPDGVTFTIKDVKLDFTNGIYSSTLVPSIYYYENKISSIWQGMTFPIKITELTGIADSSVKEKTLTGNKYNQNNIIDLLGTTNVNIANLAEVAELINFPNNTTYEIRNPNVVKSGIYTSDLVPSAYYLNGVIVENTTSKTFPIKVFGLNWVPDSIVNQITPTGTKYNLNNIADLLGTDTVNMTNLAEIATLAYFPTNVIFTIENVKLDFVNGTYTSDLKPSKYFAGGFEIVNDTNPAKTFEIKVSGLKGVENSEVINKQIPGDIDLNNVQDKLKNADGNTVNRDVLGQLIDLTAFPENTAFTADFANSITDQNAGIYTLNMTADKQYMDGKAVDQPKNFELKLEGFYVAPALAPTEDSTGLTVGLVIGGVVLVLLLVGLYIWNKKRIQAAGGTPDGKDGKAKDKQAKKEAKAEKSKQAKDLASTEVKTNDSIKIAKTEGSLDQSNVANPAQVNDHNPIELGENKNSAEPTSSTAKNDKAAKTSKTKSLSPNKTTNIDKPKSNSEATKKLNVKDDHKKSSQQTSSTAKNDKAPKTSKTKSLSPNKTTNIDKPKSNPQATKKLNASDDHKKSSQQTSTEAKNDKTAKDSKTKSLSPDQTTSKNTNIDKQKSNPQATEKLNASDDHKPESVNETKPIDEAKAKDFDKKA